MKTGLSVVLLLTMVCTGCVKEEEELTEHNCELIQHVAITGAKDQYFEGYSGVVYITHENGKLKATFCSVGLRGSNGSSTFTTTAVGAIKAP